MGEIYVIRIADKFYYGSTTNLLKRKISHKDDYIKKRNKKLYVYIESVGGWDNVIFESVEIVEDLTFLRIREQYYLDLYKNDTNCLNTINAHNKKEDKKTYQKQYREAQKAYQKAYQKQYREAHKEQAAIKNKQYRETHKEEISIRMKKYRKEHHENSVIATIE